MVYNRVTDEEVKAALIASNGRISEAAKALSLNRSHLHTRIKKSVELSEIRANARAMLFSDMSDLVENAVKTGYMTRAELDEEGKPTGGKIITAIPETVRLDAAFKLMQMFKGDDGIVDKVEVDVKGTVPIDSWLKRNTIDIEEAKMDNE